MPTVRPYTTSQVAADLLADVSTALANARRPVARKGVVVGAFTWDECCDGALYVGLPRRYRSNAFPVETEGWRPCDGAPFVWEFVVLLLRCVPVLTDRGTAPTADAITGNALAVYDDADRVWDACASWIGTWGTGLVASQQFVGAEGGCIGVETRLLVNEVP